MTHFPSRAGKALLAVCDLEPKPTLSAPLPYIKVKLVSLADSQKKSIFYSERLMDFFIFPRNGVGDFLVKGKKNAYLSKTHTFSHTALKKINSLWTEKSKCEHVPNYRMNRNSGGSDS